MIYNCLQIAVCLWYIPHTWDKMAATLQTAYSIKSILSAWIIIFRFKFKRNCSLCVELTYIKQHILNICFPPNRYQVILTHWGRVTHICVCKLTIISSDNGLLPGRRPAIIWTNARILLVGPLETNFSEILIEIHIFLFKKAHLKWSSVKWRPFCLGVDVLNNDGVTYSRIYQSTSFNWVV